MLKRDFNVAWRKSFLEYLQPGGFSGAKFGDWLRMLSENRFAIDARYWPRALLMGGNCLLNSCLAAWEAAHYGSAIGEAAVPPPLFILGIWRSGTTHLHNLLARDPRFAFPSTYEVFYPHTFLTTEASGSWFMQAVMPETRPMDNVKSGVSEPQEDEFALVASGLSFMIELLVFPRHRNRYQRFLTLEDATPAERERWKKLLLCFLQKLTFKYQRPLLLKSPAHTGRIRLLLEMFPDAKFVHIHRHPYDVFQSTVHMSRTASSFWALQSAPPDKERILENYVKIHDAFFADRTLLTDDNFCEVRFEDLERDPLAQLRTIYSQLGLPSFSEAEPAIRKYNESLKGYQRNSFPPLPTDLRARIAERWSRSFEEWGYAK